MAVVLVTGGSGLLGVNWAIHRRDIDEVHLLLHKKDINIDGVSHHRIDLLDCDAIHEFMVDICRHQWLDGVQIK